MFSIKLIENIVEAFASSNTSVVASLLKDESFKARENNKNSVARRLENLIKILPTNGGFSSSSLSGAPTNINDRGHNSTNPFLFSEYFSNILPEKVILNSDSKEMIRTLFSEWEDAEKLLKFGLHPVNKILLYGPPGTGKTKLAYAIANKLNFPLVLVRLDELISSYLGKTGQNIREIFELAKNKQVVILLDEIDTVAKHRADEKELGELKRIVTVLLQNIDLFPAHSIIIGATNHDEIWY